VLHDLTCVKLEAFLDLAFFTSALRMAPYVDAFRTLMYGTVICVAVGPRASMYGDVRCRKAYSRCVQRRILLARTWARRPMPTCEENANLLKAGNRALESVRFMTQRAPRRPLPTSHHSNDLVPLPAGTIPDDDAVLRNVP